MEKEKFIDEFMDSIYLIGSKEDEKYILTRKQAEQAASQLYNIYNKSLNCDCAEKEIFTGNYRICTKCKKYHGAL